MKTNRRRRTTSNPAVWLDIMAEIRKQSAFFTKSDRVACLRLIECVCALAKVLFFEERNEGYEEYCAFELLKYIAYTCREFNINVPFPTIQNEDYLYVVKRLSKGEITSSVLVLTLAYCLHVSEKMYVDEYTLFILFKEKMQLNNKSNENETK